MVEQTEPDRLGDAQPWQWPESVWRGYAEHVLPGRRLLPNEWPDGARAAVAVSFDSDHESTFLRDGKTSPGAMAQGHYGSRAGVPRILREFAARDIPLTFFIPAVSALLHPVDVAACVDHGHEIALHGWIHERNMLLAPEVERDLAFRAADTLEELAGTRPVGIRTPSWDFSESTLRVTRELGLLYDSSLMSDDEPFEIVEHHEATGIVEIPVSWIRDDAPYFMMDRYSALRPYAMPRGVTQIWRDEFIGAYEAGSIFQLTLHPHISGHRSRLIPLLELIDEIADKDVWFATHQEVAEYVSARDRC